MVLQNEKQISYYLNINVLKDIDVTFFNCEVDGNKKALPISNQGHYALYLGNFKTCRFEESDLYTISLQPWEGRYEEAIKGYSLSLLQTIEEEITKEALYNALPCEPTERIYHIFKRLLSMMKMAVKTNDSELKHWVFQEVLKQQKLEYTGVTNYKGNWWVFEIGIPRCLNEILILYYPEMDKEELCQLLATENFYIPQPDYEYYRRNYPNIQRIKTNYANLADTIYICLLRSVLWQDASGVEYLASLLPDLLKITDQGNGFYPDGSFLYHTIIPYNASYGEVLLHALVKNLEIFYLLSWDMKDCIENVYERIEHAYLPFLYHQRALDCVRGRASSRKAGAHYSYKRIMTALHNLVRMYAKKGFLDILFNEEETFHYEPKAFAFSYMHRYIKRNNDYLIAISACSDTVANYESINGENLLGSYQGNFTFDLYFNESPKEMEQVKINPLYRNGSTNVLRLEEPNQVMKNQITAGVAYKDILNTCFHQKNQVEGYFSKFILRNSFVAVGSGIHSNQEYISTIYSFEESFTLGKSSLDLKRERLIFKEKPTIKRFIEERSFHDLNQNEPDEKVLTTQTRVYYENPKEYEYQFYPIKMCIVDEYKLHILSTAHVLEYLNMILWNSFTSEMNSYRGIKVGGAASLILIFKEREIEVVYTSKPNQKIKIQIDGYSADIDEDGIFVSDQLSHCIKFRRNV